MSKGTGTGRSRLDGLELSSMIPMVRGLLKLECQWVPQSEFGAA